MFSGQSHADAVPDVPCSFGPDSSVEPDINAHIWSPHLFHGKLPDLFDYLRSPLLEAHFVNVLVSIDGLFPRHHLADGRM